MCFTNQNCLFLQIFILDMQNEKIKNIPFTETTCLRSLLLHWAFKWHKMSNLTGIKQISENYLLLISSLHVPCALSAF